jgi:DNA polymerase III epsilon subunit-like protein
MYLFNDTETGGIDCYSHSLLTTAFLLVDDSNKEIDRLVLKVKPDDNVYHVRHEALNVNKINLVEHTNIAISYKEAAVEVVKFLNKNAVSKLNTQFVGHRIEFDAGFLKVSKVMDDLIFRNYVGKYFEDTSVIASFLKIKFNNLSDLATQLKIDISDLTAHTEMGDCEITRRCYFKMQNMVWGDKSNG